MANADQLRESGYRLLEENRLSEALAVLEEAIRIAPGDLLARLLIGRLFLRLQEPAAAQKHFQRILKKMPASEPAKSGLVDAALARGHVDEAERLANQMLALSPRSETGLFAAARVAEMQCAFEKALAKFDELVRAAPDNPNHRYHRSRVLLRLGRFAEGWRDYEFRFAAGAARIPAIPTERWSGAQVGHLLLVSEQGLGDTIQFARFIPLARRRADKLTLACPNALAPLIARSFGVATVDVESSSWPEHNQHLPLLSLPHVLALGDQALAPTARYLQPDPATAADWAPDLASHPAHLRVGVVHATSVAHATEQRPQTRRSCLPADLAPLGEMAGIDLIDLQIGSTLPAPWQRLHRDLSNFDDSTAVIDSLDVLLSVDTAAAHVAGGLGKPLLLLLPFAADWRWMQQPSRTDWYSSAQLFRQAVPGNWSDPIARAAEVIRSQAEAKRVAHAAHP